jgi:hypothetical protein
MALIVIVSVISIAFLAADIVLKLRRLTAG